MKVVLCRCSSSSSPAHLVTRSVSVDGYPRLDPIENPIQEDEEDERSYRRHEELVASLPEDRRWAPVREFQGFWFRDGWLPSILAAREHFVARPSDVFIASVPKSGTTWLKSVVFSLVHRGRHPHPHHEDHPVRRANPHDLVHLHDELYRWCRNPNLSALPPPRIFSTHTPFSVLPATVRDAGSRVVYIVRDPKDTFVSTWHFLRGLEGTLDGVHAVPLEEALDMFCAGVTYSGPFWRHVLEYWEAHVERPDQVFFLRYEAMKGDPVGSLKSLAAFLGCPFTAEEEARGLPEAISELCSFRSLSGLGVNRDGDLGNGRATPKKLYFRKGEVGDWRNHLTPEMAEKLDKITDEKLRGSGLSF